MTQHLNFNLEQFQHNMNILLMNDSFTPIKRLKIQDHCFSFSRGHCKTTLFLDTEQNVERIMIKIKLINSGFVYVLPAMIAQATQAPIAQDETSIRIMRLLMNLSSCDLTQTSHIVIEKIKYIASWDAEQNYMLNIYPLSANSDQISS